MIVFDRCCLSRLVVYVCDRSSLLLTREQAVFFLKLEERLTRMSFWNHFGFQQSAIDTLLEKPDVTLEQLMDDPDLIQECKSQNRKLIELFVPTFVVMNACMLWGVFPQFTFFF